MSGVGEKEVGCEEREDSVDYCGLGGQNVCKID